MDRTGNEARLKRGRRPETMTTIVAINDIDTDHLEAVQAEMTRLGAPEIRAYWTGEMYLALEGSHRLAAADALGITPTIIEMYEDDEMMSDLDMPDEDGLSMEGKVVSVSSILSAIADANGPRFEI
jgi:hypothetical protein